MTGLMAMSMGVAYPACIAAEMIVKGEITRKGVLSPATDMPCDLFMDQLKKRGIKDLEHANRKDLDTSAMRF